MPPVLDPEWLTQLTPFQAKCCVMLLWGKSYIEMAAELGTSPQVVKNMFHKLYLRFGITEGNRRVHLVRRLLGIEGENACLTTFSMTRSPAANSACTQPN
jgi:DNA-binding CsgD family transcriptional regulator